jgi:hypothetical protein
LTGTKIKAEKTAIFKVCKSNFSKPENLIKQGVFWAIFYPRKAHIVDKKKGAFITSFWQ